MPAADPVDIRGPEYPPIATAVDPDLNNAGTRTFRGCAPTGRQV